MKLIDNSHLPKVTGTIDDTPVTDRMSPEAIAIIRGLVITLLAILAAIFIGQGL